MEFINYNKGQSDTNNGLISYQDLMGLHEFTDNPINNPVEPFEDFRGRGAKRRADKRATKQGNKLQRINARQSGKVAKKQASPIGNALKKAQDNKSKKLAIKDKQANANVVAAKNAGKNDPAIAAALANNTSIESEKPKSNTGLYIGLGIGAVVLGVGAWLLIKKTLEKEITL